MKKLFVVVGALAVVLASGTATASSYVAKSAVEMIDKAPTAIDRFTYSNFNTYADKNLGYTLRYTTKNRGLADVYIYPVADILTDHSHSEIVKIMIESAIADIRTVEESGMYEDFSIVEQSYEAVNQKITGTVYATLINQGKNASTALYLTEDKGQLFKIRITELNSDINQLKPSWDLFADTMFTFLIDNNE